MPDFSKYRFTLQRCCSKRGIVILETSTYRQTQDGARRVAHIDHTTLDCTVVGRRALAAIRTRSNKNAERSTGSANTHGRHPGTIINPCPLSAR